MDQGSNELRITLSVLNKIGTIRLTCSTGWPGGSGELVLRETSEVVSVHVVVRLQAVVASPRSAVVRQYTIML